MKFIKLFALILVAGFGLNLQGEGPDCYRVVKDGKRMHCKFRTNPKGAYGCPSGWSELDGDWRKKCGA